MATELLAHDIDLDALTAYSAEPVGTRPCPGVVMIHEVWGLDDVLRRQADHLAGLGYRVLAPDLYSRGGARRCLVPTFRALTAGTGPAFDDIEACRRHLLDSPRSTGTVGIIGFCMGGGFALATTTRGFDAAAPCYGRLPSTPEALRGGCGVVASYGGADRSLRGAADKLERALTAYGIDHDVKEYPGAGHSFMNDEENGPSPVRPVARVLGVGPDPAAAADAWRRIDAFFAEQLRA